MSVHFKKKMGHGETIALMATLISLTALAIDIMLPALPEIGADLSVAHANDTQLIISTLILGLSIGQLFYGPYSDHSGRRPMLIAGILIFIGGCTLSLCSTNYTIMLAGRILQGIGLAGPRSIVMALIRDQYEGRMMARIMSSIMAVFIIVPAFAPAIGQAVLAIGHWRSIFGLLLLQGLISLLWFLLRQPETLSPDQRIPFSPRRIMGTIGKVCRNRIALGYTIVTGCVLGSFLGYLNSAQQIFQTTYQLDHLFPVAFGALSLAIGSASLLNARIVMRFGMRKLSRQAMGVLSISSLLFTVCFTLMGGRPPLWLLMFSLILILFGFGILFGNLNTIAMAPLGHIAGTGAAIVGALSSLISVPLAVVIGRAYNGTVLPLFAGFAVLTTVSLLLMVYTDKKMDSSEKEISTP